MADILQVMALVLGFSIAKIVLAVGFLLIPILLGLSVVKMLVSFLKKNGTEQKDEEIIRLNERLKETEGELSTENRILRSKGYQCQYLCNLLDQHQIDWETGWRQQ